MQIYTSSFTDALAVAGCDYVILGPKVLKALNEAPTAQGYNDGLSAKSTESGVTRVLSPKTPSSDKVEAWERVYQRDFDELIGMAGKELVDQVHKGVLNEYTICHCLQLPCVQPSVVVSLTYQIS